MAAVRNVGIGTWVGLGCGSILAVVGAVVGLVVFQLARIDGLFDQPGANGVASAHEALHDLRTMVLTLGLLALAAGGAFAGWLARQIRLPMQRAVDAAHAIAAGRLDARIDTSAGYEEAGRLLAALDEMQAGLRHVIGDTARSAAEVSSAADQLASASQRISDGARAQSESIGSTASSVEQVTVSFSQVADHAREAAEIAGRSASLSHEGETIVRQASSEMNSIAASVTESSRLVETLHKRSSEISTIVKVIKDIADQTNLLALNAAIEAARAGEQGRGFAVVADEVRKLAERTGSATAEIGNMIDAIQRETSSVVNTMQSGGEKVGEGVRLADEAASALGKISAEAAAVLASVNQIADAVREQQTASADIARNIERIAAMTEENTAAAAQTSSAAQTLATLAEGLKTGVARFQG